MRLKVIGMTLSLACLILAGCHGQEIEDDPQATPELPSDPVARQDTFNMAALDAFPMQVRNAFRRDFPNVAITQAQVQPAESGPLLYRIVFIREGQPQSIMYDRAGLIVSPATAMPTNLPPPITVETGPTTPPPVEPIQPPPPAPQP